LGDLPTDGSGAADANALIEVTVGAGEKLEVEYEVKHPNTKMRSGNINNPFLSWDEHSFVTFPRSAVGDTRRMGLTLGFLSNSKMGMSSSSTSVLRLM